MDVKKIPSVTPDPLAERHQRIQSALPEPAGEPRRLMPQVNPRDALMLYGILLDQHAIVGKRIREIVSRPVDSRQDTLRVIDAQLAKMRQTVKEMLG